MNEQLAELLHNLPKYLGGHMLLSATALGVGLLVSLPLGILVSRRRKLTELTLGVAELKHLRIFISFEERSLYVTGADAGSKATKAAALGVRLLDEAQWLALANGAGAAG